MANWTLGPDFPVHAPDRRPSRMARAARETTAELTGIPLAVPPTARPRRNRPHKPMARAAALTTEELTGIPLRGEGDW